MCAQRMRCYGAVYLASEGATFCKIVAKQLGEMSGSRRCSVREVRGSQTNRHLENKAKLSGRPGDGSATAKLPWPALACRARSGREA